VGSDLDERLVYAVDADRRLVAVDLETRAVRSNLLQDVRTAAIAGDGSLYAVDGEGRVTHLLRRTPTRYRTALPGPPRHLFGALNDRVAAITAGADARILLIGEATEVTDFPAPPGEATATWWGDLLAVGSPDGIALYDTQRREQRGTIPMSGPPRAIAFSPSGHRLYVARERGDLVVLDRFSRQELAVVDLDQPVQAIRTDVTGRWVLLRPAAGDSLWVMDATTNRVAARVSADWAADLPLVAGAATLVVRHGDDLEAWDLSQAPTARSGTIRGGAADFWTLIAWVPAARASEAAAAVQQASATQDSVIVFGAIPVPPLGPTAETFLQVSSSQNPSWARELARQLTAAGYSASVRDPGTSDEGYRVVIGPFPTREAAEEVGRQLGRPYFVLTEPAPGRPR